MIFSLDQKTGNAPAVCTPDGTVVTYGELTEEIAALRPFFSTRQLVFCLCRNEPGALLGYLAALEWNSVPLLLDAALGKRQLHTLFTAYAPSYFWAPTDETDRIGDLLKEEVFARKGYGLWKTDLPAYPMGDKLNLLLATSGSTGSPKLVRLSRRNVEANADSIRRYLSLSATERPITTLPFQYTYGLSVINSHLLAGACLLMTRESYAQQRFWDFFERACATSLSGVPYTYEILRRLSFFAQKPSHLTSLTQAGGKLPVELQTEIGRWAQKYGIRFYVMYGQTEATARMSYLPPERCLDKPGSIGIAIPGGELSLVDDRRNPIDRKDTVGELVFRGENVSLGYAERREDLLLGDERRGILYTGDLARRDEDGYYYIVGRRKRFVKLAGVRISLDTCEALLRERFPGAEFACTGDDDHLRIFGTDPEAVRQGALWLPSCLHLNKKLFEGICLPELPKNEAGKIQYAKLQSAEEGS